MNSLLCGLSDDRNNGGTNAIVPSKCFLSGAICKGQTLEAQETGGHLFSPFTSGTNPLRAKPEMRRCLSY